MKVIHGIEYDLEDRKHYLVTFTPTGRSRRLEVSLEDIAVLAEASLGALTQEALR